MQTQQIQITWKKVHGDWAIVSPVELNLNDKVTVTAKSGKQETVQITSRVGHMYYGHVYRISTAVETTKPAELDINAIVDRIIADGIKEFDTDKYDTTPQRQIGKITTLKLAELHSIHVKYGKMGRTRGRISYNRKLNLSTGENMGFKNVNIKMYNEDDCTFLHEMSHYYDLEHCGKKRSRKANNECVAEMSSYILCEMYGLQGRGKYHASQSFGYVGAYGNCFWDKKQLAKFIAKNKPRIYAVITQAVKDMTTIGKQTVI